MSTNNKLIKIDLNQMVSRFELAEIQKDKKRWYIVFGASFFFVLILIFNYFILNNYTNLLSSRLNDIDELDAKQSQETIEVESPNSLDTIEKNIVTALDELEFYYDTYNKK